MNDSTRDGMVSGDTGHGDAEDYRIREAEARLDRRMAALESRYGFMRGVAMAAGAAFVLSLLALVVGVLSDAGGDGTQTIRSLAAQEITLRDDEGIERGRMATDPEGRAVLSLSDRDGRERIRLTVLADGSPGVTIHDPEARPRAVLGYLPDGTTNLVFTDRAGEIRTLVGVGPDGKPSVTVFDGESDEGDPETS